MVSEGIAEKVLVLKKGGKFCCFSQFVTEGLEGKGRKKLGQTTLEPMQSVDCHCSSTKSEPACINIHGEQNTNKRQQLCAKALKWGVNYNNVSLIQ